jgi:hypothetical protein
MIFTALESVGVGLPEILLPAPGIDMSKWAVVACDQFTSQPGYWEQVEKFTGSSPSTLHLIFPEIYLEEKNVEDRIRNINRTMKHYLEKNFLRPINPGFVLVDRKTTHASSRKGLVISLDLERYDFSMGSRSLIRATEGTIVDRLPPRVRIRKDAPLELPHIMVLIDDEDETVIEPLSVKTGTCEKLYDFELMMDGGHIKGYKIDDTETILNIARALEKLCEPENFKKKYGVCDDTGILLFAVGDGNHSLASAKVHWEEIKKSLSPSEYLKHPARYALVEVVNVHDKGIIFESINRVLFNVNPSLTLSSMEMYFSSYSGTQITYFDSRKAAEQQLRKLKEENYHVFAFTAGSTHGAVVLNNPKFNLETGTLQDFLDRFLKDNPPAKIDYIHGNDVVESLGSKPGNIGFYLPSIDKHDLFRTILLDGALPRKTFSMGEAEEKRYYLECRKIV